MTKKRMTPLRKLGRPTNAERERKRRLQEQEREGKEEKEEKQAVLTPELSSTMSPDLASRIAGEGLKETRKVVGPAGNFDFVELGSDEHAAFLGFVDNPKDVNVRDKEAVMNVEMVFDFAGVRDRDVLAFKSERIRMLQHANPPPPDGCPERWDPDAL